MRVHLWHVCKHPQQYAHARRSEPSCACAHKAFLSISSYIFLRFANSRAHRRYPRTGGRCSSCWSCLIGRSSSVRSTRTPLLYTAGMYGHAFWCVCVCVFYLYLMLLWVLKLRVCRSKVDSHPAVIHCRSVTLSYVEWMRVSCVEYSSSSHWCMLTIDLLLLFVFVFTVLALDAQARSSSRTLCCRYCARRTRPRSSALLVVFYLPIQSHAKSNELTYTYTYIHT